MNREIMVPLPTPLFQGGKENPEFQKEILEIKLKNKTKTVLKTFGITEK